MATVNQKLASSLKQLQTLQRGGRQVFRAGELTRTHRERLIRNRFLYRVMPGWLIASDPNARDGDTTSWFAAFWQFCAVYCATRFGQHWHLSPAQSLLFHGENTIIPKQLIVHTPQGGNNITNLLFGTSLYDLRRKGMPPKPCLTERGGLRLLTPETALVEVPKIFFRHHPVEAEVVLSGIRNTAALSERLLEGGHPVVAGRLTGAFRRINRAKVADEILDVMRHAGYDIRETDPFAPQRSFAAISQAPAIAAHLQSLWQALREPVLEVFPPSPGLPGEPKKYLSALDDIYQRDSYHSLSIEGYRVTPELVEKVRAGNWNPQKDTADSATRDALAARGYWQAFRLVRAAVARIITDKNAAKLVRREHGNWYRELFQPGVAAGLIPATVLAGYRNDSVFLHGSRHVPPRSQVLPDAMSALFDLLEAESEPAVRAVLGHWLIGYIHPYPDGNGRIARFVMNAVLASGGYPWTVIRVEDRAEYMAALESVSVEQDVVPFAKFIGESLGAM